MATPEKAGLGEFGRDKPGRDESRPYRHRKVMRLRHYDYSQASAYFVTICTHNRACTLGEIQDTSMIMNESGRSVNLIWQEIPNHYTQVAIDAFVVMPNHVHGILFIQPISNATGSVGARFIAPDTTNSVAAQLIAPDSTKDAMNRAPTLGEVARAFKARCTHAINKIPGALVAAVWQRNYYEHIIRDEDDLMRIREYIDNNPAQWALDEENPEFGFAASGRDESRPYGDFT